MAIVVFGENPYAEWHGDIKTLEYRGETDPDYDVDLLQPSPEASTAVTRSEPAAKATSQNTSVTAAGKTDPDVALLQHLHEAGVPVVAVFITGRPRVMTSELAAANAFVVAWQPGTEGEGVADVLFKKSNGQVNYGFTGKLSFAWPRDGRRAPKETPLFAYGFGMTY